MAIQSGVWGIDLGQCALKAIRLQEIDGAVTVTAFDYVEHPKILSQPDADPDQLTREALEKFLSRNTLRGDTVAISVPGQSGLARFVKLPPVEEKKIADIVRFEAKQQIPFNLDEVVWDYQRIGAGDVTDGFAMNIEIGLFAMKRDMIGRYLQHFKDVGVEVHLVQMAPLALCNFVCYDLLGKGARTPDEEEEKSNCVVALDIGADSSNLIITDADRIIWQRPIPLGGNHFTRALTKELKLTFAKAEHLKRNAMKSPDLKKILTALKPVLNDFVGEVQRSLGYFTNTHRDAPIAYMVGLGNAFRLPGLQRYLGEKLQLEVRKLTKLQRAEGGEVLSQPSFSENVLTFGVAYGLALQGLKQARLLTNLLPGEIRTERLIRAKKPWAVAAAALLVVGTSAMAFHSYREAHVYANPEVAGALTKATSVTGEATRWEGEFKKAQDDAQKEEQAVRSIVAGQPEFKNWLELTKFLSDCLPQPDSTNLPAGVKKKYWADTPPKNLHLTNVTPMSGKQAFDEFTKRLGGKSAGIGAVKDELGTGIDDLVQINLQSFDARFTDDLAGFWEAARKDSPADDNVRPRGQEKTPPEGKGWIIELKGYTYHYNSGNFLRDTLLENLASKGDPDFGKTPATPPLPGATTKAVELDIPASGPIKDRISHVLLYRNLPMTFTMAAGSSEPPPFGFLAENRLDGLASAVKGGTTAVVPGTTPSEPVPGRLAGVAVSPREAWTPLGTYTAGAGKGAFRDVRPPVRPTPGTVADPTPMGTAVIPEHKRTEFVILFVWREPTPSAPLRKDEGDATPGAPGQFPVTPPGPR